MQRNKALSEFIQLPDVLKTFLDWVGTLPLAIGIHWTNPILIDLFWTAYPDLEEQFYDFQYEKEQEKDLDQNPN